MSNHSTPSNLIPTADAAKRLGVSVATVNRWADKGILREAYRGTGTRGPRAFRATDIEALVAKRTTGGTR